MTAIARSGPRLHSSLKNVVPAENSHIFTFPASTRNPKLYRPGKPFR